MSTESHLGGSYYHSTGPTPLVGETIDAFLRGVIDSHAEREALVSVEQGLRLTYSELHARVEELARGLLAIGVERGDRVGVWSTNNAEWVVLQLATARIGAVLVNVDPAYRAEELAYALARARVQVLALIPRFRTSDYVSILCEVCPEAGTLDADGFRSDRLPDLRRLVVFDPSDAAATRTDLPALLPWGRVVELGRDVDPESVRRRSDESDCDDPVNIQFTSGTTGRPKATVLTHHNLLNNALATADVMGLTADDRLCVPVPLYHCFGIVVSNLVCLVRGGTLVLPTPHFEAGAVLDAIQSERCTVLHGVPTMFVAELECPAFARHDLTSLRTGIMAGAPCPPELVRRVVEDMGCREILIGYGMTEASPITHLTRRDDPPGRSQETVGVGLPHQETKVIDPHDGRVVPLGEQGEVCTRGYQVMRGYFEDSEATAQTVDEAGWLHSGDLGTLDEDGVLRLTGRLKDMIIRGGENIFPAEIEAFYFDHPLIVDVAVFGVPDPKMGEEVGAFVRLREGERTTPDELRAWAKGEIAHHKIPRYLWLVEEFPMTVTGKIQKFRMRELATKWLAAETNDDGTSAPAGVTHETRIPR